MIFPLALIGINLFGGEFLKIYPLLHKCSEFPVAF